jgi:hypothetical protein
MILSRPRKSDTVLVSLGAIILLLLILGIFFVVRRQPEMPREAPNAPGAAAHQTQVSPNSATV